MNATLAIVALWALFAATHVGLSSSRLRPRLVGALGAQGYQGVYSLIALAVFVALVWVYFTNRHAGPLLWFVPLAPTLRWTLYVLMGVAFVLMVGGLVTPSAASMAGGRPEARGVLYLTRHPLFMGLGVFGLLHMVPNGFASDVAFFAGFPLFALLGCWHQDQRSLAGGDEAFRRFYDETPFLPFTGRQTVRGLRELSPIALLGGIGVTVLLRTFHPALFGG